MALPLTSFFKERAMIDDFDNYVHKIWEQKKTPLEKMYDKWVGPGNWEPPPQKTRYAVYSWDDIVWRGKFVLAGNPFPCHPVGSLEARANCA